jgi:hypothetical protein
MNTDNLKNTPLKQWEAPVLSVISFDNTAGINTMMIPNNEGGHTTESNGGS